MLTSTFAAQLASDLSQAALSLITDPRLRDLLQCQAYFALYAQQKAVGDPDPLLAADAPAWLKAALELLEK